MACVPQGILSERVKMIEAVDFPSVTCPAYVHGRSVEAMKPAIELLTFDGFALT